MGNILKKKKNAKKSSKIKHLETFLKSNKVCAIFDYISVHPEELSFEKNDILHAIIKSDRLWWYAKHDKTNKAGYIPRNFVIEHQYCHLFLPAWHDIGYVESNRILMKSDQAVGTFLIRPSSDKHHLVLSIKCNDDQICVKNYRIIFESNAYYIFDQKKFHNLAELIQYYIEFSDGLICTLGQPLLSNEKPTLQFRHIEVKRSDFSIIKKIGQGHFSDVFMAKHMANNLTVAVKILKQNHDDRKTFLKEARLMHQLHHDRIVRILGVCTKPNTEPMYIITEWMENGSLLDYLKIKDGRLVKFPDMILLLMEISEGMAYLESKLFIHRDLRAANILVGKDRSAKVADFGLARIVEDLYIATEDNYEFPLRWMAQEVLRDNKFSLKSDVWSFGILMFEVITHGIIPYPDLNTHQVSMKVKEGYQMEMPNNTKIKCPEKYFSIMQKCWLPHRERPAFSDLLETFKEWANLNENICSN